MIMRWILAAIVLGVSGSVGGAVTSTVKCSTVVNGKAICSGSCADMCTNGCCTGGTICCVVETELTETTTQSNGNLETALIVGIAVASFFGLFFVIVVVVIGVIKCVKKKKTPTSNNAVTPTTSTASNQTAVAMNIPTYTEQDDAPENKPPSYEFAISNKVSQPPRPGEKGSLPFGAMSNH